MELGLAGETHRPCRGKGKGGGDYFRRCAQAAQGSGLLFQGGPAGEGIDKTVLLFKIAVNGLGQGAVGGEGGQVGFQVLAGGGFALLAEEAVVNQAVLGGDFGRGVAGCAAADGIGLQQQAVGPGFTEEMGAEEARDAAANDEDFRFPVAFQRGKGGERGRGLPDGFHGITSCYSVCAGDGGL